MLRCHRHGLPYHPQEVERHLMRVRFRIMVKSSFHLFCCSWSWMSRLRLTSLIAPSKGLLPSSSFFVIRYNIAKTLLFCYFTHDRWSRLSIVCLVFFHGNGAQVSRAHYHPQLSTKPSTLYAHRSAFKFSPVRSARTCGVLLGYPHQRQTTQWSSVIFFEVSVAYAARKLPLPISTTAGSSKLSVLKDNRKQPVEISQLTNMVRVKRKHWSRLDVSVNYTTLAYELFFFLRLR